MSSENKNSSDLFVVGAHQFRSWANGSEFNTKWFGQFDHTRSAEEQWVIADLKDKLLQSSFPAFKRGWDAARAEFLAAMECST